MTWQDTAAPIGADGDERAAPQPLGELIKADILEVATAVFAEKGLNGARVDEIAELMRRSKPMIYYHFRQQGRPLPGRARPLLWPHPSLVDGLAKGTPR